MNMRSTYLMNTKEFCSTRLLFGSLVFSRLCISPLHCRHVAIYAITEYHKWYIWCCGCSCRWALFPDSSESQARYMNRHEEALLSLADSRYDWDLRIGRLESCLKKLEAIGEALMGVPEEERKNCTVRPSFFKQIHVACFRRIFGANTQQVIAPSHCTLMFDFSPRFRVSEQAGSYLSV